jgi:hypothetical protein
MNVFVSNFDALYSEYQEFILGVDTKDLGQLLPLTNLICLKPRGQPFGHSYVPESITLSLPTTRFMLKEARKFQLLLARPEISPFGKAAPLAIRCTILERAVFQSTATTDACSFATH